MTVSPSQRAPLQTFQPFEPIKKHQSILDWFLDPNTEPPPRPPDRPRQRERKPLLELPAIPALTRHAEHHDALTIEMQSLEQKRMSGERLVKAEIARLEYLKKILHGGIQA